MMNVSVPTYSQEVAEYITTAQVLTRVWQELGVDLLKRCPGASGTYRSTGQSCTVGSLVLGYRNSGL